MKKKPKRRRAILTAGFPTAADAARILGVSSKRPKELRKIAESASKSGKKKRR